MIITLILPLVTVRNFVGISWVRLPGLVEAIETTVLGQRVPCPLSYGLSTDEGRAGQPIKATLRRTSASVSELIVCSLGQEF